MFPCTGLAASVKVDSSDEEAASRSMPAQAAPTNRNTSTSRSTQTVGSIMDHALEHAERSLSTIVLMPPIKQQFWDHVLSCMKMPRGGVAGGGSMRCEFEFVAANEQIVQYLMEDLPVKQHHRFNLSQPAPHWEASPSMSTYHALDSRLLDSFFRLHRRLPASRGYRGSLQAPPPDGYSAPVCILTACPPLIVELCHRKHTKLVLAVSFNLVVVNNAGLKTPPASLKYVTGMDVVIKNRALSHLKKLLSRGKAMSLEFRALATAHHSDAPDSEGDWVPPPSALRAKLGLPPRKASGWDSGEEADSEADVEARVAKDTKRPRGSGTRWGDKLRQQ